MPQKSFSYFRDVEKKSLNYPLHPITVYSEDVTGRLFVRLLVRQPGVVVGERHLAVVLDVLHRDEEALFDLPPGSLVAGR